MSHVSTYSTAGGGTVLEHRYGAVLLSYLLSGSVLPELGRTSALLSIEFQSSKTPTDDFLVTGTDIDGRLSHCSIGARRNPLLRASSPDSVKLIRRFMETIEQKRPQFETFDWWVCLAAAVSSLHAHELNELAAIAYGSESVTKFRARFDVDGPPNLQIRNRLAELDKIMKALVDGDDCLTWSNGSDDLSYELLRHLRVRTLHLEGVDETDRVEAINRVIPMTTDGDGERLFARLEELSSNYAISGATVTEEHLRRDLGRLVADDYLVAASGRRVGREPMIVRHNRNTRAMLNARRRVLRATLGLSEKQIDKSFLTEPELPSVLNALARGKVLALRGPLGAGKSDMAIRWLLQSSIDESIIDRPLPVWISADSLSGSVESELNSILGSAAVDRYEIDIVIDGIDERVGNSTLADAQTFAAAHNSVRVLVTTREGEQIPGNVKTCDVPLWAQDEARALVARIADTEPYRVGHGWTDSLSDATRRPLFALIAGLHYKKLGNTPAALIAAVVESSIARIASSSELEMLAVAATRANGAVDPLSLRIDVALLLKTRLVELTRKKLRFTLPIFEQWFASQALLRGDVPVQEFAASVVGFAHWRYVLAIATTTGSRELVEPIMHGLVRSNPGAAAWVIREGMSTSIDDDAALEPWKDAGESILRAMTSWFVGLEPVAPALPPFDVSTGALDNYADDLELTIGTYGQDLSYGWAKRQSGNHPQVLEWTPASRNVSFHRSGFGPAKGENWVWKWSFDQIRGGLSTLLSSHQLLAQVAPEGVVGREFLVWLAAAIVRKAPLINEQVPVAEIRDAISVLRQLHVGITPDSLIKVAGELVQWRSIDLLSAALSEEPTDQFSINLYAGPDIDGDSAAGRILRYSGARLTERIAQVYEQAGVAYTEIVGAMLPKFGHILAHSATFPAVISGSVTHDPIGSGDLGSTTIEYRWVDEPAHGATPVTASLTSVDGDGWKSALDQSWNTRADLRLDDSVRNAFGLFYNHMTSVVDSSVFRARPATALALDWIGQDLNELGWSKTPMRRTIR